jgi:hypothetical protein
MTTKPSGPLLITGAKTEQHFLAPEERPVLALKYKAFDQQIRNIRVIGTWFLLDGRHEPCIVLFRRMQPLAQQTPCIVRLSMAWVFGEPPIGDPEAAAAIACDFAHHLGLNPFRNADVIEILTVIQDRIPDLIKIPPAPPMERIITGDVSFRTEDGQLIERDLWHHG